jgi:hypothetical protein
MAAKSATSGDRSGHRAERLAADLPSCLPSWPVSQHDRFRESCSEHDVLPEGLGPPRRVSTVTDRPAVVHQRVRRPAMHCSSARQARVPRPRAQRRTRQEARDRVAGPARVHPARFSTRRLPAERAEGRAGRPPPGDPASSKGPLPSPTTSPGSVLRVRAAGSATTRDVAGLVSRSAPAMRQPVTPSTLPEG